VPDAESSIDDAEEEAENQIYTSHHLSSPYRIAQGASPMAQF
jgi:hypothetical protein